MSALTKHVAAVIRELEEALESRNWDSFTAQLKAAEQDESAEDFLLITNELMRRIRRDG